MARSRGWKSGDWLVKDEESGFTTYGSKVAYDYYGVLKLKSQGDHAHPQDFVKALEDPYPVYPVSQPFRDYNLTESVVGFHVGTTDVATVDGPALHIFRPGVDDAIVMYDDFVYGPVWTPATVLQASSPSLWLDASIGVTGATDGSPVSAWASQDDGAYSFVQATGSKQPLFRDNGINGLPAIDFDGTDDILVCPTAFLTGNAGTVVVVYQLDSKTGPIKTLLASCDESSATRYLTFEGSSANATGKMEWQSDNAGTANIVLGSTNVAASSALCGVWQSNGSAISMRSNGVIQTLTTPAGTNTGDWFDDIDNKDNVTIGAAKITSELNFMNGRIAEIIVYPVSLSYESLQTLSVYIATKYGVQA